MSAEVPTRRHTIQRKGREGLSDPWHPARGLREECATSPLLFNIYRAEAMRAVEEKRKQPAHDRDQEWSQVEMDGRKQPPTERH